jgi:hypothetical protein
MDSCSTFEPGCILEGKKTFEIDSLEVWGCGGTGRVDAGLRAQREERESTAKCIERARTVDKAAFFNNQFDREFLLGNTTNHHGKAFSNT